MSKDGTSTNSGPEVVIGLTVKEAEWLENQISDMQTQSLGLMQMLNTRSKREKLSPASQCNLEALVEQSQTLGGIHKAILKGIIER